MTAPRSTEKAQNDGREPTACPVCGDICRYDGWDLVHPDGIGIGSCREARRGPANPPGGES